MGYLIQKLRIYILIRRVHCILVYETKSPKLKTNIKLIEFQKVTEDLEIMVEIKEEIKVDGTTIIDDFSKTDLRF